MRLNELTFPNTIESAAAILRGVGYKRIGTKGTAYGWVFYKPGEKSVLKLYKDEDYAFTDFVDFCLKANNDHFPRFSRRSIPIKHTSYRAVKIELLTEGDDHERRNFVRMFDVYRLDKEYAEDEWGKEYPSLLEAFGLLCDHFEHNKAITFDLHFKNFMFRGNVPVIIDPIIPNI